MMGGEGSAAAVPVWAGDPGVDGEWRDCIVMIRGVTIGRRILILAVRDATTLSAQRQKAGRSQTNL